MPVGVLQQPPERLRDGRAGQPQPLGGERGPTPYGRIRVPHQLDDHRVRPVTPEPPQRVGRPRPYDGLGVPGRPDGRLRVLVPSPEPLSDPLSEPPEALDGRGSASGFRRRQLP